VMDAVLSTPKPSNLWEFFYKSYNSSN
jgi:hypothetical protein